MGSKRTKISFANTSIAYAHYSNRKLKKALGVFQLIGNSFLTNIGTTLTKIAIAIHFPIGPSVKPIIFEQFCGGESLKECIPTINLLQQRKVDISLNYGVEIKNSARDFERTLSKTKGAIEFASLPTEMLNCPKSGKRGSRNVNCPPVHPPLASLATRIWASFQQNELNF